MKLPLKMCRLVLLGLIVFGSADHLLAQAKPSMSSPRLALLAAMQAKSNAKSYRLKEVQSGGDKSSGFTTVTTTEFVAPDKSHNRAETQFNGTSSVGETILIGETAYLKMPGQEWQKKQIAPGRGKTEFARLRHELLIESLTRAKDIDVKLIGKEELNGSTMSIYQYSFVASPEVPIRIQAKIWVGEQEGLPYQIETGARVNHKGLKFNFKTTTTYSDYNSDIKIEAPL